MNYEKFKLNPVDALYSQICEANPLLRPGTFTVTKVTDLGAAANPNTVATIVGDGIGTIGTKQVTFNRLNPKNTFSKYVAVIKRPTIDVFGVDAPPVGQNMTLATLANDISKVLGISLTTAGTYADADGSQTVTMPSAGSAVDSDITINKPNSLRFRPSATDKLPIRLRNAGIHWSVDAVDSDIRPRERNDIDDSDKSLVCHIPFGETLDAAFAGDYVNLPFNAAAGYALSGDAVANVSGIALSTSELSKSDELLLMPFNQSLIDLVTGTNGSIASGTAYYDSPGMRRDIGLRSTNCSATVPN